MHYSDKVYLSKFSIDPEFEETPSRKDRLDKDYLEMLCKEEIMDEDYEDWKETF